MPKPDFLIVGAPKCGTTALHDFLAQHPQLHLPKKEFHHFGHDLRPANYAGDHWDRDVYEALFDGVQPGQLCGESSVWYLYSTQAAREIHERNPEAKVIIMLRSPADMMYSLYNMFIWVRDWTPNGVIERGTDRVMSFEEGLDTQEARKQQLGADGDPEAVQGRRVLRLFHTDAAMYSAQVQRYLDTFPREQIHVVFHDDLVRDPNGTYRAALRFLRVHEDFSPEFRKVNASRDIKNVKLHRLMNDHGSLPWLRKTMRALMPRGLRKGMFRFLKERNVETKPQEPMHPETRERLMMHFREDVERLSDLLGEDVIERWYHAAPVPMLAEVASDA